MFNKNIHSIAVKNYHTKAVGLPRFDNPYLLKSSNEVLNDLLKNKQLLDRHRPPNQKQDRTVRPDSLLGDLEDLARHVMREVYEDPGSRRDISGYTIDYSMSTPETVAYVGKDKVLFGLRGSVAPKDYVADAEVGLKNIMGFPDALSETLINRYKRDDDIYKRIRAKYPNRQIIMGGHSLGNTLGMNILKNHQDDRNIKFFGYNGWIHPDYNKDTRAYHTRQEGDLVSTFTPADSTIDLDPATRLGVGGVAGVGALGYYGRKMGRESIEAIRERVGQLHDRTSLNALNSAGEQVTREEIESAFPEYVNVRTVLENSENSEYDELLATSGFDNGLYIRAEDADAFSDFLFSQSFIKDANDMDWTDLHEALREYNSGWDLAAHPELTDATDWADATDMIDPFYYPHNVYVTDGDDGLNELNVLSDTENIEAELNPVGHSGVMDQSRITSSEILDTPGTIQLHTGTEVLQATADEDAFWMVTAGEAALDTLVASTLAMTGTAVAGAAAYWLWSHSAKRFKLKNNLFKTKKLTNFSK